MEAHQDVFAKCRKDLVKEGVIKSAIWGLVVGSAVCFIIALATWFTDFNGLWLSIGALIVLSIAMTPVFYFTLYRPNNKRVAERLDRLGFDERIITMNELKDDDSFIARLQRQDAVNTVVEANKRAGGKLLTVKVAIAAIVAVSVIGAFGVGMTAVTGLAAYGVIPNGADLWHKTFSSDDNVVYTVKYNADNGGKIQGNVVQSVQSGKSTLAVVATADDGFMFVKWIDSDGNEYTESPSRYEDKVYKNMVFTAYFEEVDDVEDDPLEGNEPPDDSNQNPSDDFAPGDPNNSDQQGPSDPGDPGDDNGGGGTNQNDWIIDGNTPYEEKFDYYYQMAMDKLANNEEIPPELREIIEGYFGILLPNN